MRGFGEERAQWRAVVADDRGPARPALSSALRRAGIVVVAEAFDGAEAVELADYHEPDLVVIEMGVSGWMRLLRRGASRVRIRAWW